MARLLLVVAAALILCGVASAATIDDLRAMGYTVTADSVQGACTTYVIDGHGVHLFANSCDNQNFQATIDGLANPAGVCNSDWQTNHPDQAEALLRITQKGWSVSGDQCADRYTVTNPNDNTQAYSGSGSGLVGFNDQHGTPPAAQTPPGQPPPVIAPPSNCLPLCPNPGDTRGDGGVVIPAPLVVAVTAALNPPSAPANAVPVDPAPFTIVPATPEEAAANPEILGWLNTPYMTLPVLSQ